MTTPQDLRQSISRSLGIVWPAVRGQGVRFGQWCASNGRRPAGVSWEVYGDPAKAPAQTRTDIYFLLEPAAGQ